MADGINGAVQGVQAPRSDSSLNLVLAEPKCEQLPSSDNTVLFTGQDREQLLDWSL